MGNAQGETHGAGRAGIIMLTSREFLKRLARKLAAPDAPPLTDYALAEQLGVTRAAMSNYQRGRDHPGEAVQLRMAELLGERPEFVMTCIAATKARTPAGRRAWLRAAAASIMQSPWQPVQAIDAQIRRDSPLSK